MSKASVAIVVQRCHESVIGGSETYAWHHAKLLREPYHVDVLTTTAVDAGTWANHLPVGKEEREGISIRRFEVTYGRTPYWYLVNKRLGSAVEKMQGSGLLRNTKNGGGPLAHWTLALQEEYIRKQGPYSKGLLRFLEKNAARYKSVIFITYLFPTTYFGMLECPKEKCLLVPTLHDEPPAYLPAYRYMATRARELLWNTDAERALSTALWGDLPGKVLGMSINTESYDPLKLDYPYLLYSGRIDPYKGCSMLIEYFSKYKEKHPSRLKLILTGHQEMALPDVPEIEVRGFVTEEEKFRLMSGALLFVMPSTHESLSVVTLEAMAQCTPVLVNGRCQVLVEHIEHSGCGITFDGYRDFSKALRKAMAGKVDLAQMGRKGRAYVADRFSFAKIQNVLIRCIEGCEGSLNEPF